MPFLYLDTTNNLTIGLLDSKKNWLEFNELEEKKSSSIIHSLIDDLLVKYKLDFKKLEGLIHIAGPGSYTGMRVSEGIAQVFEWQGISVYSICHFQVPALLGINSGAWLCKAFKGEFFLYKWDGAKIEKSLHSMSELEARLFSLKNEDVPVFTHFKGEFEVDLELSALSIKSKSKDLFTKIINEGVKESPFYFRTLDQEFKTKSK